MSEKVRVSIVVEGRVQGVFFRQETLRKARKIDVFGFVRNLPDSRVEAVFEGDKEKVQEIIEWMKKGPKFAKVKSSEVSFKEHKGEFDNFEIKY